MGCVESKPLTKKAPIYEDYGKKDLNWFGPEYLCESRFEMSAPGRELFRTKGVDTFDVKDWSGNTILRVKGSLKGEFIDIDSPLKVLDVDGKAIGAIETSKKNGPFFVFDIYAGEMRVATVNKMVLSV